VVEIGFWTEIRKSQQITAEVLAVKRLVALRSRNLTVIHSSCRSWDHRPARSSVTHPLEFIQIVAVTDLRTSSAPE